MVKANTIIAVFSLILLILMASIVYAGDLDAPDATPRATVSLSQIKFSPPVEKTDQSESINANNTVARKNSAAGAGDRAKSERAKSTASGESAPSSADPADAPASAGLSAGDGTSEVAGRGSNDAAAGAAPVFLGSADDTCMGSSSAGGQGAAFGFSLGTTWTDENCKMLKNARELKSHGHHAAAKARLCMDNDNALAFELAGEPCPRALPSAQAALKTIREQNPSYRAAANQGFQVAALTEVAGGNNPPSAENGNPKTISSFDSSGEDAGAAAKIGTLIAMLVSAVNQVASSVSANFDVDWDGVSAMDGHE